MNEEWRPVTGYEGRYEVSNIGHVRNIVTGILLNGWNSNGYRCVSFPAPDRRRGRVEICIHRLVAIAFIPNPENKPEVDHINGIRNDNRAENLRWATHLENVRNVVTAATHAQRIRETHRTPEFRAKMSAIHLDPAFKEKTKDAYAAAYENNRGKAYPTLWRAVRCVETGEVWASVKDAALATGNTSSTITKSCRRSLAGCHRNKTVKNKDSVLHFEYVIQQEKQ